jgi:hypothetical protein
MSGILYFIQPSEYSSTNIYKIGYSEQSLLNRIKQYGSKTSIICILGLPNARQIEKELISVFNYNFDKHVVGNEYFICDDVKTAKNVFYEVCNSYDNGSNLDTENDYQLEANTDENIGVKSDAKYSCLACNYTTPRRCNYDCHLLTKRHKKLCDNTNDNIDKNIYNCKVCKYSTYKHSNYTKHLGTAKHIMNTTNEENKSSEPVYTKEMFIEILNQNKQLIEVLHNSHL